jgi:uncharacterized Tic20 family protein
MTVLLLFLVFTIPHAPLVLHHVLEIVTHLHAAEKDVNLRNFVYPMQLKFLKD